jgi:hypothetical protein
MNIFKNDYDSKVKDNAKMLVESALNYEDVYEPALVDLPVNEGKKDKKCLNCSTMMSEDAESGEECPNCNLIWDKKAESDISEEE